jgi:hypothetical protein
MVLVHAAKTHNLENLSTTTTMESNPQQTGKSVTKSRETLCQGPSGMGSG